MLHGWQYLTPADKQAILEGIQSGEPRGGPYHIELDWFDRCNARCFFCNSRAAHSGEAIAFEHAIELLGGAPDLRSVRMAGGGEPLLHPRAADLLAWLAARGIALDNLNTNGIALTDTVIDALMQVRVNEVRFSLNYPDAESYSRAMGVAPRVFDRVCEAIARLNDARRGNPHFGKLLLTFYIHHQTAGRIEEMYRLALHLGADQIEFRELTAIDPAEALTAADIPEILRQLEAALRDDWNHGRIVNCLQSAGLGDAWLRMYYRLAQEFGTHTPSPPQPVDFAKRYCYMPWYSLTLMGSAAVYPCCFYISIPNAAELGSLKEQTIEQVWRGPAFRRMRREMRDYLLLQERVPFFARRNRMLLPICASHSACPLTIGLCDEEFYTAADAALDQQRRRPLTRLWRGQNLIGRKIIDRLRH